MKRQAQAGFTLLELTIIIMILGVLAVMALPAIFDRLQTAKVEVAVQQARSILQACDIARKKVVSSTTAANRTVTHTYNSLLNWSTTAALQAQLSGNQRMPLKNRFGKDILVRYDARRCYVAVDLDFRLDNIGGHQTQVVNGMTRIIVSSRPKIAGNTNWVGHQKRLIQNEVAR